MQFISNKKNLVSHIAIWLGYLVLIFWFNLDILDTDKALVRSLYLVLIQCGAFYINASWLLPKFFEKKNYAFYLLLVAGLVFVSVYIMLLLDQYLVFDKPPSFAGRRFSDIYQDGPPEFSKPGRNIFGEGMPRRVLHRHMAFNGFTVVITLFISTIYRNLILANKRSSEAIQLKSQVLEAESRMLKSQINPHFLFNTLNNIYALSQVKSDRTPDAIHRLSDMLRYVIYDCNEEQVSLGQEIDYISGYISLQLLKDQKINNITFDHQQCDPNFKMAPLLLIGFIENSFKHSNFEDTEKGYVNIHIQSINKELHLMVENGKPTGGQTKDNEGGIGLENVKKRLELIYQNNYELTINNDPERFTVNLILKTIN